MSLAAFIVIENLSFLLKETLLNEKCRLLKFLAPFPTRVYFGRKKVKKLQNCISYNLKPLSENQSKYFKKRITGKTCTDYYSIFTM